MVAWGVAPSLDVFSASSYDTTKLETFMSVDSLLQLIPRSAAYKRLPLDARLNALEPWQSAVEKFAQPDEDNDVWNGLIYGTTRLTVGFSPDERGIAEDILAKNVACLESLEQGIERGQLQFAEFSTLEQIPADTDFVQRLGELARLPLVQFKLHIADESFDAAAEDVLRLEQIGEMICHGEGQMLHYLIGLWMRGAAVRGMAALAAHPETPAPVLRKILRTLDEGLRSTDGLVQSLRIDLSTIVLAQLARTIDDADLQKVVDRVLDIYFVPRRKAIEPVSSGSRAAIADGWLKERRAGMLCLLRDHPLPFDKAATARRMGRLVADTIRDLSTIQPSFLNLSGKLHRMRQKLSRQRLEWKLRYWPMELAPGPRKESTADVTTTAPGDIDMTTVTVQSDALSEARLAELRPKIRRVSNPIGLVLVENHMSHDYSPYMLEHRAKMKAMHSLIRQRLALM